MVYTSIVPSNMSNTELRGICGELVTAANWGISTITIQLSNGLGYKVDVSDLETYQDAVRTECGAIVH